MIRRQQIVERSTTLTNSVDAVETGWTELQTRGLRLGATASSNDAVDTSKISHGFHEWYALVRDWVCAWSTFRALSLEPRKLPQ